MNAAAAEPSRASRWGLLAAVALGIIALDQAFKAIIVASIDRGDSEYVLPFLDLVHVRNEGVAFGFLGGGSQTAVLAITALALVLVLGWFAWNPRRPGAWLAIGLLAGGALGNLIDRVARDGVIDFIDFPAWPSFNIADIAITFGAAALALSAFRVDETDDERT